MRFLRGKILWCLVFADKLVFYQVALKNIFKTEVDVGRDNCCESIEDLFMYNSMAEHVCFRKTTSHGFLYFFSQTANLETVCLSGA
jgi:hypothetical protein